MAGWWGGRIYTANLSLPEPADRAAEDSCPHWLALGWAGLASLVAGKAARGCSVQANFVMEKP